MSALAAQRELWSARPRDWSEIAEPRNHDLYFEVLDRTDVAAGVTLLDIACGSGYLAGLAAARGARVSGVDIAPALLTIARERVPAGDLREADMEALPYPDGHVDVVTAVNALQFAADPDRALAEAARVLRPGGRLAVATFAEPERNQGTALHLAMQALITEPPPVRHAPYALSGAGALATALERAGLRVREVCELPVTWTYADRESALRGLLASAGGAQARAAAGEDRVRAALSAAMEPFVAADEQVRIANVFRIAIGARP